MKIRIRQIFIFIFISIYQPTISNSQVIEQLTFDEHVDICPKIILDNQNNLWVFYGSCRNGNWNIYAQKRSLGDWSESIAIAIDTLNEHEFDITIGPHNNLWITWSATLLEAPVGLILAKKYDGVEWSPVDTVAFRGKTPKISCSSSNIWIFWNSPDGDIVARSYYSGTWGDTLHLLEHYRLSWLIEYSFGGPTCTTQNTRNEPWFLANERGHAHGEGDWLNIHAIHLRDTTWSDTEIGACNPSWDNPNPCSLIDADIGSDTNNRIYTFYSKRDTSGTKAVLQTFNGSTDSLLLSAEFNGIEYFSLTENSDRIGISFTKHDSIFAAILADTLLINPLTISNGINIKRNREFDNIFDEDGNLFFVWQGIKNNNYYDIFLATTHDSFLTSVNENNLSRQVKVSREYYLYQNYPNPFNGTTKISFKLAQPSHVTLKIFNLSGQLIKVLTDQKYDSGSHQILWDGKNQAGEVAASGVYYYQITTQTGSQMKKMVFLQ